MPKKYFAGLSKSTAKKRKTFWKGLGKYPFTKSEYERSDEVPGDSKQTRPSKYNKKYRAKFVREEFWLKDFYSFWGWIKPDGSLLLPTKEMKTSQTKFSHNELLNYKQTKPFTFDRPGWYKFSIGRESSKILRIFNQQTKTTPKVNKQTLITGVRNILDTIVKGDHVFDEVEIPKTVALSINNKEMEVDLDDTLRLFINSLDTFVSKPKKLKEVFEMETYYSFWGWIKPDGSLLLPTIKQKTDPIREFIHDDILPNGLFPRSAFGKGWYRFFIEEYSPKLLHIHRPSYITDDINYETVMNGVRNIEKAIISENHKEVFPKVMLPERIALHINNTPTSATQSNLYATLKTLNTVEENVNNGLKKYKEFVESLTISENLGNPYPYKELISGYSERVYLFLTNDTPEQIAYLVHINIIRATAMVSFTKHMNLRPEYSDESISIDNFDTVTDVYEYFSGETYRIDKVDNIAASRRIFSTVIDILNDFNNQYKPDKIVFTADKDEPSRVKLYDFLTSILKKQYNYDVTTTDKAQDGYTMDYIRYNLSKKRTEGSMNENSSRRVSNRIYQKGFDGNELREYIGAILGTEFDIKKIPNLTGNAVMATKNDVDEITEETKKSVTALKKKEKASGVPYSILKQVYNRGMAAWVTGHRTGATQSAWAFARVNSFLTKGKTWYSADADLAKKARKYLTERSTQPGEYVYHASYLPDLARGLRSILSKGLVPSKEGYGGTGVYFAYEPEGGLYHVGKKDAILFRAKWSDLVSKFGVYPDNPNGIRRDNDEIIVPRAVPVNMLEIEYFLDEWWKVEDVYDSETRSIDEAHMFNYTDWGWITPEGISIKPMESDKTHTSILRRLGEKSKYGLSKTETEFSVIKKGWVRWLLDKNALRFNTKNWNGSLSVQKIMMDIINKYLNAEEYSFEWDIVPDRMERIEVQDPQTFMLKLSTQRRKMLMGEEATESENYAWYWHPLQGILIRPYSKYNNSKTHESMAGGYGFEHVDEFPRGQFYVEKSSSNKYGSPYTSISKYPWAGKENGYLDKMPKDVYKLIRQKLKIPKSYKHYSNDTNKWIDEANESVEIISETIACNKKTGKKVCFVFSKKGKKLGGPYSETKAKKRLRQIEFFKHLNK
jgi:hypothetical protein